MLAIMRPAIVVLVASVSACAVSQSKYEGMAEQTAARNETRTQDALRGAEARGYRFVPEELRFASLADDSRRRCMDAGLGEAPIGADEPLRAWLEVDGVRAGRPDEVEVRGVAVCEFFRGRGAELTATAPGGEALNLVRIARGEHVARDKDGALAIIVERPRVISRRTVEVDATCDRMPRVEPDPLERGSRVAVIVAASVPQRVEIEVEREELTKECTHETH